jgi:hypothetical protein
MEAGVTAVSDMDANTEDEREFLRKKSDSGFKT